LDDGRLDQWLTDDARYWMGGRRSRYPKSSKAIAILDLGREVEGDLTKGDDWPSSTKTKEIARREFALDQDMLSAKNVSMFF